MKKSLIIIGSLIITIGFIGGGAWYWQKNKAANNQSVIANRQTVLNQQKAATSTSVNSQKTGERLNPILTNATTSIFEVAKSGGIIFSTDGKMTMEIPEGAVTSDQKIMIGITDNIGGEYNTGAVGSIYKVMPIAGAGLVSFLKPVKIEITYNPQILPKGAIEGQTAIATLGAYDSWEQFSTTTVDTVNHKLTSIVRIVKWDDKSGFIGVIPGYVNYKVVK